MDTPNYPDPLCNLGKLPIQILIIDTLSIRTILDLFFYPHDYFDCTDSNGDYPNYYTDYFDPPGNSPDPPGNFPDHPGVHPDYLDDYPDYNDDYLSDCPHHPCDYPDYPGDFPDLPDNYTAWSDHYNLISIDMECRTAKGSL